jgi:signal transduction histidine kinase
VWDVYKSYIIATIIVVGAQLLLIAGLLQQRARLRRADNTIREREASLRVSYERIRQMAGHLINAQETTRAEIARDLHDDVCQRLTSVSIGVAGLKHATGSLEDPKTQPDA